MWRSVACGAVVLLVSVAAPPSTSASTPRWAIEDSANKIVPGGQLAAISCRSATTCVAVGSDVNTAGDTVTLAEVWNGTSWSVQPTPNPKGAAVSSLSSVSCTATACAAVGYSAAVGGFGPGSTRTALAEVWNGSTWAIQPTPSPPGSTSAQLFGVSCGSATACMAVGLSDDSGGNSLALAEEWDGTAWTLRPVPNPAGATFSYLAGVSCRSASACTAVGGSSNGSGSTTLAEFWDGTTWSVQATPTPTGGSYDGLAGVSCSSATACMAVGSGGDSTGATVTLAESWNGVSWSVQPTQNQAGNFTVLNGVSCASATSCIAVGSYNHMDKTLAEVWNGSTWKIQPTPVPAGANRQLSGVSCPSTTGCEAAGFYNNRAGAQVTLTDALKGTRWSDTPSPSPRGATNSWLSAVSCSTSTTCAAVGYYYFTSQYANVPITLAEMWNGRVWSVRPTPNPPGAIYDLLDGVSCTSAVRCTAVGYYYASGAGTSTLAESWNGSTWTIEPTPNPSGASSTTLTAVSCSSATACTSVGYSSTSSGDVTLAESWNGSTWTIEPTPNQSGASYSHLTAVSCSSPTSCAAVGSYSTSSGSGTLALSWNGATWTVEPTPNPPGGVVSGFNGVSCSSDLACVAVGGTGDASGLERTLADTWNGTTWTIDATPNPTGAHVSELDSVSCPTSTTCIAVGRHDGSALGEDWNGTSWALQSTPTRHGTTLMNGISCSSIPGCTSVGGYNSAGGLQLTLVERYS